MGKDDVPKFSGKSVDFTYWRRQFTAWVMLKEDCHQVLMLAESGDCVKIYGDANLSKANEKLFAYLYLSLDRSTASSVLGEIGYNSKDGAKAWESVLQEWANKSDLRKTQLREKLHTIEMRSFNSVNDYVAAVREISNQFHQILFSLTS